MFLFLLFRLFRFYILIRLIFFLFRGFKGLSSIENGFEVRIRFFVTSSFSCAFGLGMGTKLFASLWIIVNMQKIIFMSFITQKYTILRFVV